MNTDFRLISGFEKLTILNNIDDEVAKIVINHRIDNDSKLTTNQILMDIFSGKKGHKEIANKILRIAELCHDSPHSFIIHMLDFVDQNLGEEASKLSREKFERIFNELYTRR
jgi:hypothetical protein